jgi:hypothetical protein
MSLLIENKEEFDELLKEYDPMYDNRIFIRYSDSRGLMVEPNDLVLFDGKYVEYLGDMKDKDENIDRTVDSIYKIGCKVYYSKAKTEKFIIPKNKVTKKEIDNSRLLDIAIRPEDNDLMVIIKQLLKGWTLNSFKELFPKDNVSAMNNARRELEKSDGNSSLSWNRFCEFVALLGAKYYLTVNMPENE